MSAGLRILLLLMAFVSCTYAIKKIRKSQMKIEEVIYWIAFAFLILLLAIFPKGGILIAEFLGVESPVNFVYLVMIFMLIVKVFFLSLKISQLEHKLWTLTQEIAIWQNELEKDSNENN
ncbi:hypothetical protein IMSAG249_02467 [Lachnospiraceae bacterium]|nr:hypothetical protein IMSAG249_02467 [Lachnospiraceae bacterium]